MSNIFKIKILVVIIGATCMLSYLNACSQAYYSALEKVGIHKRDIMVDRVQEAKQFQEDARDQFQSALEEFSSVAYFSRW